jgi:inorganic pyrophosphatase
MIGDKVKVIVDRQLGSEHPVYAFIYPINYGYVEGILAGDGEFQDAYILGVKEAVESFEGEVIAIIHRKDDIEDKWVVAPVGSKFTKEEIEKETWFQEQWFLSNIITED